MQDINNEEDLYMVVADFAYKNENRENNLEIIDYDLSFDQAQESKQQALRDSRVWTDWEIRAIKVVKQGEEIGDLDE